MLGKNMKKIRESKGLGVNELSRRSGVNASYISSLERDEKKNPSLTILEKLADALDVNVNEFMKNDTYVNSDNDPEGFKSPEDAIKFILKQPSVMDFGGFDINKLKDEEILEFANDLLNQLKLLGLKYKK